MKKLSEMEQTKGKVTLAFGGVGTGKTLLIMGQPTPHLVLACDTGNITVPPGINKDEIFVEEFHVPTREFNAVGQTTPIQDIYRKTVRRLHETYTAISTGAPLLDSSGNTLPILASL